jgi:hypothetical protein
MSDFQFFFFSSWNKVPIEKAGRGKMADNMALRSRRQRSSTSNIRTSILGAFLAQSWNLMQLLYAAPKRRSISTGLRCTTSRKIAQYTFANPE